MHTSTIFYIFNNVNRSHRRGGTHIAQLGRINNAHLPLEQNHTKEDICAEGSS
jgi:hypothetical protein